MIHNNQYREIRKLPKKPEDYQIRVCVSLPRDLYEYIRGKREHNKLWHTAPSFCYSLSFLLQEAIRDVQKEDAEFQRKREEYNREIEERWKRIHDSQ